MPTLRHPILRGFNPAPSFLRVGDDYYLATSTFEWFPGVQLHLSRDLVVDLYPEYRRHESHRPL